MAEPASGRNAAPVAAALGLALAVAVFLSWLTYLRDPASGAPGWVEWLPGTAAAANACAAVTLAVGFVMVRRRRLEAHRNAMLTAVGFSAIFFGNLQNFTGMVRKIGADDGNRIISCVLIIENKRKMK